ncbi:hypothetical protein DINM_022951 [Dirofilaria immitis]|nr:hypothetical protein [Dirofilaria immitis]
MISLLTDALSKLAGYLLTTPLQLAILAALISELDDQEIGSMAGELENLKEYSSNRLIREMPVPNGNSLSIISNNEGNICSLLLKSVEDERIDVLRSILAEIASKSDFHEQVDQICYNGGTVLHYAVIRNSVDSVRTLLSAGVNPCIQNDNNDTAYRSASSEEVKNAFVQELLQAVAQSNLGRVCQMISAGVSVDSIDATDTGNSALHWSASYGNEDVVRILCQSGANVNMLNTKNETALHDAVRRGNDVIVKCLLSYGADPNIKNKNGEDCYELAIKMGGIMLPSLSLNTLNRTVRRTTSTDSEIDRSSLISIDTAAMLAEKTNYNVGQLENWTDLLWPQPKYIDVNERKHTYSYPKDGRLKIYFDKASKAEPRHLMQIIQMSASILSSIHLELDYRGHQTREQSSLDGRITCGVFENGCSSGSYTLMINENGMELYGEDYTGIRHGFSTLTQILRIFKEDFEIVNSNIETSLEILRETIPESKAKITGTVNNEQSKKTGTIPCLTIRDSPDSCFRAVYQDFSGCKILNAETMTQVCDELLVKFVPSLDVQSSSIESDLINDLPPFVTLCVEGKYPFEAENLLSPRLNVVLRFSTSDAGAMICDLSTGCEIMPPSLSYMSELASLGVCWNKSVDIKRFCFLLPRITAEHFLLDGQQVSIIGRVEHEITRFSYGLKSSETVNVQNSEMFSTMITAGEVQKQISLQSSNKKKPISVFVEMILNPDNMVLEQLTPVIFKKARIELNRSLKALNQTRKHLPYNYELALVLAEIQFVTELMILVCKLGQSLCTFGINPSLSPNNHKASFSSRDRLLQETTLVGYHIVNIGVSNLPPAMRTDFANRLLEIRSRFQHTWLSRNIASTLPNALKIFDNLFRTLLPPNMQDYGKNLL